MEKFRFESLLKIRESERDEKKSAYLEAQRRVLDSRELVKQRDRALRECQEETRASRIGGNYSADDARNARVFSKRLLDLKDAAERELVLKIEEEERRREEFDLALKECKILQALKEKWEERDSDEERRSADKEMDELATRQKALERQKFVRDN
ncbi:MAG: hypothetical protein IJM30_05285 [Thermoguttaceae bacterium]|nr:hypothetical protein [Thermoguttaceae bacterium]